MSRIDENQIHERLEHLSQIEPSKDATERAIQKARDVVLSEQKGRVGLTPPSLIGKFMKLAAAAVLMIGAGYIAGRVSAPEPLNVQELTVAIESSLKSSLEPALKEELLGQIDEHLQSTLIASHTEIKDDIVRQVRLDLEAFTDQTLTAVSNLTDQRLMQFARMIEAARIKERQQVAAAFDYMGTRFGNGLVNLATQRNNLPRAERISPAQDISEN